MQKNLYKCGIDLIVLTKLYYTCQLLFRDVGFMESYGSIKINLDGLIKEREISKNKICQRAEMQHIIISMLLLL